MSVLPVWSETSGRSFGRSLEGRKCETKLAINTGRLTAAATSPSLGVPSDRSASRSSLWTPKEASAFLNVSESTLCRWRRTHEGPSWINLKGIPRYRREDLDQYVSEHLR